MAGTITFDATRDTIEGLSDGKGARVMQGDWETTNIPYSSVFDYFHDSPSVNDAIYFAFYRHQPYRGPGRWHDLTLYVGTARTASGAGVWEYWDGDSWETLTCTDNTNGMTTTGENTVEFDPPSDWNTCNLQDQGAPSAMNTYVYYIRYRLTNVSGIVEGGAQSTQRPKYKDYGIQVVGTNGGDWLVLDDIYDADQTNSWNMIEKYSQDDYGDERFWEFKCSLWIGDGSTETKFRAINNIIFFDGQIVVTNNSETQFGDIESGNPETGCTLYFRGLNNSKRCYSPRFGMNGATVGLYNTKFMEYRYVNVGNNDGGTCTVKDCQFGEDTVQHYGNTTIERASYTNIGEGFRVNGSPLTISDIAIYNSDRGIMLGYIYSTMEITVTNAKFRNISNGHVYVTQILEDDVHLILVDPDGFDNTDISVGSSINSGCYIQEKYSINLNIVDKDRNAIENVSVSATNSNGDEETDTTDAQGDAQVIPLRAQIDISAGTGAVLNDYNPITLKISKDGYKTYLLNFDLEEKKTMMIALQNDISSGRNEIGEEFR